MRFKRVLGLLAIGGAVAYAQKRRGGELSISGFKNSLRSIIDNVKHQLGGETGESVQQRGEFASTQQGGISGERAVEPQPGAETSAQVSAEELGGSAAPNIGVGSSAAGSAGTSVGTGVSSGTSTGLGAEDFTTGSTGYGSGVERKY